MNMLKYILRRILLMIIVFFGITVITFCISHFVPGNPIAANLGQSAMSDPEIVEAYEEKWGLNDPLPVQYYNYMKNLFQGDLGTSIRTSQPVLSDLAQYIPATFEMATMATIFSIIFGLLFGLLSAARHNKLPDHTLRVLSLMGISIPAFWLSVLCLYVFYLKLGVVPGSGRVSSDWAGVTFPTGFLLLDAITHGEPDLFWDALQHLILPSFVLAASTMGILTRTVRSSMLEVMQQDYLRTAKADYVKNDFAAKEDLAAAIVEKLDGRATVFIGTSGSNVEHEIAFAYGVLGNNGIYNSFSLGPTVSFDTMPFSFQNHLIMGSINFRQQHMEEAIHILLESDYDQIVELIDRETFAADPMDAYNHKIYCKNAPLKTAVIWNEQYIDRSC